MIEEIIPFVTDLDQIIRKIHFDPINLKKKNHNWPKIDPKKSIITLQLENSGGCLFTYFYIKGGQPAAL